jgi:tetratricopeptide (TPR) repeat protein
MKYLIYKLKLALHLVLFILKLSANFSNKTKPAILIMFVAGLLLVIGGISLMATNAKPKEIIATTTDIPKNSGLYYVENLSQEEITKKIEFWEQVLALQPQSRDVLLNLAHLYSALQLEEKAEELRFQALEIDPNNPLFE